MSLDWEVLFFFLFFKAWHIQIVSVGKRVCTNLCPCIDDLPCSQSHGLGSSTHVCLCGAHVCLCGEGELHHVGIVYTCMSKLVIFMLACLNQYP